MRKVNAVVVFTESDRSALAPLAKGVRIVRIPLSTAVPLAPLDPVGRLASVLFVGNFMHRPNVDAALWLMRSIFPRIRRARPDAALVVAGAGPTDEIRSMAGGPITVTGTVDSLVPFLDAAAVIVAPLRDGGGMRVKLLEALAAGKAVVASPLAAAGLDVGHGRELSIAEDESQFAAEVVRLLDDPVARLDLARGARSWACAHLGWERSVHDYEALHRDLLMLGAGSRGVD
jgi:glycosyltransferase involved in cell wall biosynthesis